GKLRLQRSHVARSRWPSAHGRPAHDRTLPPPQLRQPRGRGDVLESGCLRKALDRRRPRRIGGRYGNDRVGVQRRQPGPRALGRQGFGRTKGRGSGRPGDSGEEYVGTYEEQRPYWRAAARVVQITLSDGKLLAALALRR